MVDGALAERLVCFLLDGQELGIPIREVKETIERKQITPLFLVPRFIAGLVNLRGDVLAVLDLGQLLGLRARDVTPEQRILLLRGRGAGGRGAVAGILVDRVTEVRAVDGEAIHPVPSTVPPERAAFFRGVARADDHPLMVLDLERVLQCDQLKAFRRRT